MTDLIARLTAALSGQYRIERELGHGGMAYVYLAEDLKHGRQVALKVLRADLAAVVGSDRFLAEVRTTATLQHPRILPLFDSGVTSAGNAAPGLPYYVMPYVAGETLRARLARERQLPVADALAIASQVASALDHAHRHGVIHRDIKPDNILLQDGEAVVADFGIALAVETAAGARLTETGLAVGTAEYMSPEQAAGERVLDARSDLYALGCVLYEMLTGEPPYTGATAQIITAKRLTLPAPSVRAVRETVPPAVEAALLKALARTPADRFATGREFAAALGGQVDTPVPVPGRTTRARAPWVVAAIMGVALLGAAGFLLSRGGGSGSASLDQNLLAVAPFDVTGPGLDLWREGVVDLLSRTLDGAGSLRTVSPSVVLRGWSGRSDRASALALGQRTGAGVVATGNLTQLEPGRVRLRATLLDAQRGEPMGEVEVEGAPDGLGALADSLGLGILRTLSRTRPVASVRQASITSAPLGALKAFLVGEQAFRRGDYDSALVSYQQALAQDSSFTLALRRMGQSLGWYPPSANHYPSADSFAVRAFVGNHGLPARESLMIAADSAAWYADTHPGLALIALARLEELVRRYPADPEAWYALGEFQTHSNSRFYLGPDALESFERALELDPDFAPPYEHILQLTLALGRMDRVLAHARRAADIKSNAGFSARVRLASQLLLLPEGQRARALPAAVEGMGVGDLQYLGHEVFNWLPDSSETAVQLLRRSVALRAESGESADWVVDSLMRRRYVAVALARRGHLRAAVREASADLAAERTQFGWTSWQDPFTYLAVLGAIPADQAGPVFARGLEPGARVEDPFRRRWQGPPWWASRGDTASLALFGRRMQEAAARDGNSPSGFYARYLAGTALAYLALTRGDTAGALEGFAALPDSVYAGRVSWVHVRLAEARVLGARGQEARARAILDRYIPAVAGVPGVFARFDRAHVAERQGDTATARKDYEYVLASWRNADPELADYVAKAKAGLARVSGATR